MAEPPYGRDVQPGRQGAAVVDAIDPRGGGAPAQHQHAGLVRANLGHRDQFAFGVEGADHRPDIRRRDVDAIGPDVRRVGVAVEEGKGRAIAALHVTQRHLPGLPLRPRPARTSVHRVEKAGDAVKLAEEIGPQRRRREVRAESRGVAQPSPPARAQPGGPGGRAAHAPGASGKALASRRRLINRARAVAARAMRRSGAARIPMMASTHASARIGSSSPSSPSRTKPR